MNRTKKTQDNQKETLLSKALEIKTKRKSEEFISKYRTLYQQTDKNEEKNRITDTLKIVLEDPKSEIDKCQLTQFIESCEPQFNEEFSSDV